jgi:oligogalacturonide lyase
MKTSPLVRAALLVAVLCGGASAVASNVGKRFPSEMRVYGQVDDQPPGGRGTGGFWHSNGSADGRWLVGDTFAGNVWLIDRHNGAMTMLTTDHKMRPDHTHPTFSPDGKRILIQSGLLSDGKSLNLMTVVIPEYLQNPR